MILPPRLRRLLLTAHIAVSVGTMGAVAGFLALATVGTATRDGALAAAVYPAMRLVTWAVIVPLVVASLLTGIVQALGTRWGLFRHYWVLIKLALTVLVAVVLLLQLSAIDYLADAASRGLLNGSAFASIRASLVVHATGGLVVLLAATLLSVYKPPGLTRYGQRMKGKSLHAPMAGAWW